MKSAFQHIAMLCIRYVSVRFVSRTWLDVNCVSGETKRKAKHKQNKVNRIHSVYYVVVLLLPVCHEYMTKLTALSKSNIKANMPPAKRQKLSKEQIPKPAPAPTPAEIKDENADCVRLL